jgi:Helix-turn-helix domain
VAGLDGSDEAKERLKVVLEVVAGRCRVFEACQRLGVSEPRFHQLREEALQGAVAALEARPAGRPRRTTVEEPVSEFQAQMQQRELELRLAQTQQEVALILGKDPTEASAAEAAAAEAGGEAKKAPRRRKASPVRRRSQRKA